MSLTLPHRISGTYVGGFNKHRIKQIMSTAAFRIGFTEVRDGKPLDPDKCKLHTNRRGFETISHYEVGRQFAVIAPEIELFIDGELNPQAFTLFFIATQVEKVIRCR